MPGIVFFSFQIKDSNVKFYVLLTVHLGAILGNDQLDALFLNVNNNIKLLTVQHTYIYCTYVLYGQHVST
jgi:hypothetical protein